MTALIKAAAVDLIVAYFNKGPHSLTEYFLQPVDDSGRSQGLYGKVYAPLPSTQCSAYFPISRTTLCISDMLEVVMSAAHILEPAMRFQQPAKALEMGFGILNIFNQ